MFDAAGFRDLYALLSGDQTLDEAGAAVDCGVRCGQACCLPASVTKYLLPGERAFLEEELAAHPEPPFGLGSLGFFDTILAPTTRNCGCAPLRELRPFNCRIFPYGPRIDVAARRVVALQKARLKHIEGCWIEVPAPAWNEAALVAWQRVLDDVDNRRLFAKLSALWEWNQADERGEDPGPVLTVLAQLESASEDEQWARVARFFRGGRDEPEQQQRAVKRKKAKSKPGAKKRAAKRKR